MGAFDGAGGSVDLALYRGNPASAGPTQRSRLRFHAPALVDETRCVSEGQPNSGLAPAVLDSLRRSYANASATGEYQHSVRG